MALIDLHPGLQKRAMPLSVKAWHQMIASGLVSKRAELIRGVIVEKMSKSILHTHLSNALLHLLQRLAGHTHWVRKEDPLTLADSEPEPDISVVDGDRRSYKSHPSTARLVIEIAVTTLAEDRDMIEIYAEAGVNEFWIVDAAHKCIEVHRQPSEGRYAVREVIQAGQSVVCESLPGVAVNVAELFTGVE